MKTINACFYIFSINTWSKNSCTHTNHGRTMLHSDRIIMTHTPATFAEMLILSKILSLHFLKESISLIKFPSYLRLILCVRSHHHDATYLHMLHIPPFSL